MEIRPSEWYEFGNFSLNPAERYLTHRGEFVALTPKALDTLFALVRRNGYLVTKEELLEEVWPDAFVEEATVVQNISTLRKALSLDGPESKFIETVPKRGYRFVASVRTIRVEPSASLIDNYSLETPTAASNNGNSVGVGTSRQPETELTGFASSDPARNNARFRWGQSRRYWNGKLGLAITCVLVLGVSAGFVVSTITKQNLPIISAAAVPFEKMTFAKITRAGDARNSAISPDGKYVAYVGLDAGQQSLRILQVDSPNDAQILPPRDSHYLGLTFSPDGNYVYYVTYPKSERVGVLYRVPVIGGTERRLISDVDSPVTFSPDGSHLAFIRGYPASQETALMIASIDGTNERKLAAKVFPAFFSTAGPAWSPDGSLIACGVRNPDPGGIFETVIGIEPSSGKEQLMTQEKWNGVGRLSWDQIGSRIILTASQEIGQHQLWQINRPNGVARRITNDLTNYRGVSLASDMNVLSSITLDAESSIWVTDGPSGRPRELRSTENDGLEGIAWTPDGQLVFTSASDIWSLDPEAGVKKALTADGRRDFAPTVTRDGRFLIYSSQAPGTPAKLWRTNIDGSNPKQLTFGNDDRFPSCSLDGKWIFYSSFIDDEQYVLNEKLWKVSIDGGESSLVTSQVSARPIVSPDGKLIAFQYRESSLSPWKVRIISYDTGAVVQDLSLSVLPDVNLKWSPDGSGLTYVDTRDGVSNIWISQLQGGATRQLTHFDSGKIFRYAWSADGKRLAIVRGAERGAVLLIRNFG